MASQLARDLDRRHLLAGLAAGLGGALAAACTSPAARAADARCPVTPGAIRGPFPADGIGGHDRAINVLASEAIMRRDIRENFAGLEGTAPGVPLALELALQASDGDCAPLAGRAVYLWQCDATGGYSLYSRPEANWLRGLQAADADGSVRFSSIVPGCYGGRAPHLHLEVFADTSAALSGAPPLLVAQLALPRAACAAVYEDAATYGESAANLARWPPERDWAFRGEDRTMLMIAMTGDARSGFGGSATIGLQRGA